MMNKLESIEAQIAAATQVEKHNKNNNAKHLKTLQALQWKIVSKKLCWPQVLQTQ